MGELILQALPTTHIEQGRYGRSKPVPHHVPELGLKCPGCGCPLEPSEVFACRIRGLKKPVCIGCLAWAVVFLRDEILPLLEEALKTVDPRG